MKRLLLTVVLIAACAASSFASDHTNLEENLPTEMEDAYPIKYRSREVQGIVRYVDEGRGNRFVYQPVLELGILPNTQFNLAGILYSGNVDARGAGT